MGAALSRISSGVAEKLYDISYRYNGRARTVTVWSSDGKAPALTRLIGVEEYDASENDGSRPRYRLVDSDGNERAEHCLLAAMTRSLCAFMKTGEHLRIVDTEAVFEDAHDDEPEPPPKSKRKPRLTMLQLLDATPKRWYLPRQRDLKALNELSPIGEDEWAEAFASTSKLRKPSWAYFVGALRGIRRNADEREDE